MKLEYRSDVDGLRAIAVLLVVAFHAFPSHVRGGFVGVDIFFVISGYLISRIIYQDLRAGTFSLPGFYARRIKRIFPALTVTLLACAVVGAAVLFPDEYQSLGKHVAGGAGFLSNFVLLSEAGYFDGAAETKPLLHLWSLGIEEQFYLIWPVLILLCARRKKDPLPVAALICAGSFAWNVMLSATDASAAFYLPVTRFWELMLGCMLASLAFRNEAGPAGIVTTPGWVGRLSQQQRDAMVEAAAWLGALLIGLAAILISKSRTFPGWWALLPTVGAASLIWAGPASFMARHILGHPALVYVGLISYPLYLWHWPILSFARIIHIKEPTALMKVALIGMAFGLAALTYRFVERPIRFGPRTMWKPLGASAALAAAGLGGFLIYLNAGLPLRYSPETLQAFAIPHVWRHADCSPDPIKDNVRDAQVCHRHDLNSGGRLVLWGDSYAMAVNSGFAAARTRLRSFDMSMFMQPGCPPILSHVSAKVRACETFNDHVARRIDEWKPDTVVLSGAWARYDGLGMFDADGIRTTVARLKSMGVKRVVVIGQFPVWYADPGRIRTRSLRTELLRTFTNATQNLYPDRNKHYVRPETFRAEEKIRNAVSGTDAVFISPIPIFCNGDGCLLVVENGGKLYVSQDLAGHLNEHSSIFFIESVSKTLFDRYAGE